MPIGKFFRDRVAKSKASASRIENRDLMEALVGGALLIAAADGKIDDDELEQLDKTLQANDKMRHFGSEIHKTLDRFHDMLTASFRMGKIKILRELADIEASPDDIEEVFATMVDVAEADGEIDQKEQEMLVEVGRNLGVNLKGFGLA